MLATLIVQMCLMFNGQTLCSTIDKADFETLKGCATAAELVTRHAPRGVFAMCAANGRPA